jgi:hypothetical protein
MVSWIAILRIVSAIFAPDRIGGHLVRAGDLMPRVSGYTLMAILPKR